MHLQIIRRILGLSLLLYLSGCQPALEEPTPELETLQLEPQDVTERARKIREEAAVQVIAGLELSLWAVDELSPDPVALVIDEQGRAYITRANRPKNSEFDIRGHRDWMTASIAMQTVEDRRAFLRETFAPELSEQNKWLEDLNQDSIHDWRDLTVEKEEVFRIEDRDGDGIADFSQLYIRDFHEEVTDVAGAVLPYGEDVFIGVGPDMWRLQDRNGDGMADTKTSISHGYNVHIGFGGHGMSGLIVGPDGKVYWSAGDIGMNVVAPDGTKWSYPNQGVIVRANPDGSDFEVFAHGLRNTHEFIFDEYGNLFSVDNDGDHPGENERMVYVVNGSDSGWRINWQFGKYTDPDNNTYKVWMDELLFKPRFEGQAAYITPPIRNYHAGPAGMVYEPGTSLNDQWRNHIFMAEFTGSPARSNIWAYRLAPKGASFDFVDEKNVLNGVLATGIDIGPDGALYLADWMDGWEPKNKGRIWKLDDPTTAKASIRVETKNLLTTSFKDKSPEELGRLLQHADMRVRQKAQFELAKKGRSGRNIFLSAINQKEHQLARVHGIWGIAQLARQKAGYGADLLPLLKDTDPEIRAQAARWLGDIRYSAAGADFIPLLADTSARVRFFAAEALGRIAYQPAVQPIIAMLEQNNDEDAYLRHAGSLALARIGQADPVVALADHPSRGLRIAAVVALRRLSHPGVARFLQDQDEFIVTEAARAVNDDYSIEAALPALARVLKEERFTNEALIRRAINANLRVGLEENLTILTDYAIRGNAAEAMRAEAIATLGVWAKPSVLDRVDGRYRGPITRELGPVQAKLNPLIDQLLADTNPAIQAAAAGAAGRLQIRSAGKTLFDLLRRSPHVQVRSEALKALAALKDENLQVAVQLSLKDKEREVRVSALELFPTIDLPAEQIVGFFTLVLQSATLQEQQTALEQLGKMPLTQTEPLFRDLLNRYMNGKLDPGIQLEFFEALEAGKAATLLTQLKEYRAAKEATDKLAAYSEALAGGNGWRGRRTFLGHETAQCIRCHSITPGEEGVVGPNLLGIGKRYSREELLRSMIDPSAKIAPGYGIVSLTLKDGKKKAGTVKTETATHLTLQTGEDAPQKIAKAEIAERQDAPSSMPPMGPLLEKRELRDLVEYLASLKE